MCKKHDVPKIQNFSSIRERLGKIIWTNFVSLGVLISAQEMELSLVVRQRDTTCIWRSLERKRWRSGGSGSSWRLENGARYEVYEEMLRVSQLGPDARSPAPLFTSRSRRRCASADSVQFTLYLNFVLLILKLTYIYIYFYNR